MLFISNELLPKSYIFKLFTVATLKIISSIFDILGLILLLDYIKIILAEKNLVNNLFINKILGSELYFRDNILFKMTIILILFFIFKFFFQMYTNFSSSRLVEEISKRISTNLFEKFLSFNYIFFLENNLSRLIAALTIETKKVKDYILSILDFFQQFIFILGICIFFISFENENIFFALIFFLIIFFSIFIVVKNYLVKIGDDLIIFQEHTQKNLYQIFNSINEIKILKLENHFKKKIIFFLSSYFRKIANRDLIYSFPKNLFEAGFLIIILSLSYYLFIFSENSLNQNLNDLLIIFVGLVRLYPSFGSLLVSLMSYKTNNQTIKNLNEFFSLKIDSNYMQHKSLTNPKFNYKKSFLRFQNVNFKYNNSSEFIFKNLNISIRKGKKIGIIGDSGTGKTTFVNLLLGLLNPTKGVILNYGLNIKYNLDIWFNRVGYVPQNVFLYDDNITNNLALGIDKSEINEKLIKTLVKFLKLDGLLKKKNSYLEIGERGKKISGGQGQRVAIGRALYRNPEFLIFDEATNSLDIKIEKKILDKIFKFKEKTIIFITHKKELLRYCDQVINLNRILNKKI